MKMMLLKRFFAVVAVVCCLFIATRGISVGNEVLRPIGAETTGTDSDADLIEELRRNALLAEAEGDTPPRQLDLAMTIEELDALTVLPGGIGPLHPVVVYDGDGAATEEQIEIGRLLYFDKRLSRDGSMSCGSCHDPNQGWGDGKALAVGFGGKTLGRHSPTIINSAYSRSQFWDGRAATLEEQALGPIFAAGEMNMVNEQSVVDVVRGAVEYRGAFELAYGEPASIKNISRAIAAFERTIVTGPSRFDAYAQGDKAALSDSEKRGLILFTTTASCSACHKGPSFSDDKFHAIGVHGDSEATRDLGRFDVTKDERDKYAFKTPGLRNIEQSGPYMHDGSLATLEQVVEFYNKGERDGENTSPLIQRLYLTESQVTDIVAFLRTLTGALPEVTIPVGSHYGI